MLTPPALLPPPQEASGFCALAFGPSGTRLAAVATDTYHTVYVYDWRKRRELFSGRGNMGDPPQVYGLEWNPYELTHQMPSGFLQFGKKHIKVWLAGNHGCARAVGGGEGELAPCDLASLAAPRHAMVPYPPC
eukprot:219624-Chlamydomonas_euryale.AAC.1